MKKNLLFVACLFITFSLFAQAPTKTKVFTGGIQAGYNASTLYKQGDGNKSSYANSFHVGVLGTTNINWLNFEFGLFYSEKGGTLTEASSSITNKYKLSYIEAPFNLLLKIPIGIKLYPYAGVTLSGLVKATDLSNSNQKINAYSQLKKFDLGINAGIGIDIFGFNLRVGTIVGTQPIYTNGPKNLVWTIALGYIF